MAMEQPPAVHAQLPERLTLGEAVATLQHLERELGSHAAMALTVDASHLSVFDSSAVAVLLELRRKLQAQGKTLHLHDGPKRLHDLVQMYGLNELLPV
jgi:phospholipid transport system transporter-binding protein